MSASSLKKFTTAVALSLSFAFAYQSLAQGQRPSGRDRSLGAKARPAGVVLHGRSVARFGGYVLNIAFTPDGEFLCVNFAADAPGAP